MTPSEETWINATETSMTVLEYVVEAAGPVGISRIAADLDISKSMAYNHLSTLRGLGYVVKRDHEYSAALRPLLLGNQVRDGLAVYAEGQEMVESLASASGETVELFVMEEHHAVLASYARGSSDWQSPHSVGERVPLHQSPPGKAILASLSQERVEEVLTGALGEPSGTEPPDPDAIRENIRQVRDSGIVFSRSERNPDVVTVSSPIETIESSPPASLAIVGPAGRLQGRHLQEDLVGQLISTTKAISIAMVD